MSKEMISTAENFGASINLSFDLQSTEKTKSFILTDSNIKIINSLVDELNFNSVHQPNMLVGPYGKGKSHIVLVFLHLISRLNDKDFKRFNSESISRFLESKKRYLPVIISSVSSSLETAFMQALQSTLNSIGVSELFPNNSYSYAVDTIFKWKRDFPDTFSRFVELSSHRIDDIEGGLRKFDSSILEEFIDVFPKVTSGAEFNPFGGSNFVELYRQVSENLKGAGYDGMYVVYDEFSKYLENNIGNTTVSETKLLQDFAELCASSKGKINLLLIGHKSFNNYIDSNLPKNKVDGWRGISGRFNEISLHNNFAQMYDIISQVILKDVNLWDTFKKSNDELFLGVMNVYKSTKVFAELDEDNFNRVFYDCYPLHPVTSFLLPRLSELVAQNERTMFTFLSSKGENTLSSLLNIQPSGFQLITPDIVFDYFERILSKEPAGSTQFETYKLASSIIEDLTNNDYSNNLLKIKIIKTIALVYIVAQFEKLAPTRDSIVNIFTSETLSSQSINSELSALIDDKFLVYERQSNGFLILRQDFGINISDEISKRKSRSTQDITVLLSRYSKIRYLFPTKYNDENNIIRYFSVEYLLASELEAMPKPDNLIPRTDDGRVAVVIQDKERIMGVNDIPSVMFGRYDVVILPNSQFTISDELRQLDAADEFYNSLSVGSKIIGQVQDIVDDLSEYVFNVISEYFNFKKRKSEILVGKRVLTISKSTQLSDELSKICYKQFDDYPIINNELVNKNSITGTTRSSRSKILDYIFSTRLEFPVPSEWGNQEKFIFKSIYEKTGLVKTKDGKTYYFNDRNDSNKAIFAIIDKITSLIDDGVSMLEIYNTLQSRECRYGLRRGVIPFYISYAIVYSRSSVLLHKKGYEVPITGYEFNEIELSPSDYEINFVSYSKEEKQYIAELERIFLDNSTYTDKQSGQFSYLVNSMNKWKMRLSKWTLQNSKSILLSCLSSAENCPSEFLFEKLPKFYKTEKFDELANRVIKDKLKVDNELNNLYSKIITDVSKIFATAGQPMFSAISSWTDGLTKVQLEKLYEGNENRMLKLLFSIDTTEQQSEQSLIDKMSRIVLGLSPRDWNFEHIERFTKGVTEFKKVVENVSDDLDFSESGSFEIVQIGNDGERKIQRITPSKISPRAQLLKNEIKTALDEMGRSITEQEKRLVLLEFLKGAI